MNTIDRRQFLQRTAGAVVGGGVFLAGPLPRAAARQSKHKMSICLSPGAIGVSGSPGEILELAARHDFGAVEANGVYLASLGKAELAELRESMKSKGIVFGAAGLRVDFRRDAETFRKGMQEFPAFAAGLERAGVSRVTTWIMPCHDSLTYMANFKQHAARLREVARVLKDHGVRLGLEYVGPKTLWSSRRYPFLHTMAEARDLIDEIGTGNVGLLPDSFHWWNAGDTEADLLALNKEQVVSVDLNDARAGVPKDQQIDNQRELPCATGVIDVGVFLNALNRIGYDGPVRAEPFNKALNALDNDAACRAAAKAMKQAFALIR